MKGWELVCLVALLCGTAAVVFLVVLPFIAAGPAYIVALDAQPPAVLDKQVHHLTEQDFSAHPAMEELIKKHKRLIRPGSTLNFLLGFISGPEYSWMPISREEEQDLFSRYSSVLEFNGTYYRITISQEG